MNETYIEPNLARVNIKKQTTFALSILILVSFMALASTAYFIYQEVERTRLSNQELSNARIKVENIAVIFNDQAKNRKNLFLRGHKQKNLDKYRARVEKASIEIYALLEDIYSDKTLTRERLNTLKRFESEHRRLMQVYGEAIDIFIETGDAEQADKYTSGKGGDVGSYLFEVRDNINYHAERLLRNSTVALQETIISVLFVMVVAFIAIALSIMLKILAPIKRVVGFSKYITNMVNKNASQFEAYPHDINDEIGDMIKSFNDFAKTISSYQEDLNIKLDERTNQLQSAHTEAIQNQEQLIQAEKLASLGQLIAGIAHELNTPAGVIHASSANLTSMIDNALQSLLKIYPSLSSSEQRDELNQLLANLIQRENKIDTSSIEQRKNTNAIIAEFAKISPDESRRKVAQELSIVGIDVEIFETIKQYYVLDNAQDFHDVIVQFGKLRLSARDIGISISRIIHLVKALKSYTNADSEQRDEIDVAVGVSDTLIIMHNKLKSNTTVNTSYESTQKVLAAPEKLNQVWTNIINNAVQAMNGPGTLNVSVKDVGKNVVVTLSDSGSGIPEEIQAKIFEPYFTTKKRGEGTGIGLHICKNIIAEHDGNIELTSDSSGTTFTITLPSA